MGKVQNFGEYYKGARKVDPNKTFLGKLHRIINDKEKVNDTDITELKAAYDKVRKSEENKILTISKEELSQLGEVLGLTGNSKKSMKIVLNALIAQSKGKKVAKPVPAKAAKKSAIRVPEQNIQPNNITADDQAAAVSQAATIEVPADSSVTTTAPETTSTEVPKAEYEVDGTVHKSTVNFMDYSGDVESDIDFDLTPKYDESGYLVPLDLLKPEAISKGAKTTEELFRKMSIMTETQMEPKFPAYYYGENDPKTGKKIPTFIIVGDFHAEDYNAKESELREAFGKEYIVNGDEGHMSEVSVLSTLQSKFSIKNIGIENDVYGGDIESTIGKGAKKEGISYIGLERQSKIDELLKNEEFMLELSMKQLELSGVNLDASIPSEAEVTQIIESTPELIKLIQEAADETPTKEKIESYITELKNTNPRILNALYKIIIFGIQQEKGEAYLKALIVKTKKSFQNTTLENLLEHSVNTFNKGERITIQERNQVGLNIMSEHFGNNSRAVMVYGKGHIQDLIQQLLKKYDGKVNIYSAI